MPQTISTAMFRGTSCTGHYVQDVMYRTSFTWFIDWKLRSNDRDGKSLVNTFPFNLQENKALTFPSANQVKGGEYSDGEGKYGEGGEI